MRSAYIIQFEGSCRASFDKFIWNSDAPGKSKVFGWLALLGRCNTADVLAKKGWPHDSACTLCAGPMEDAAHLLASCPFSVQIWQGFLRRCNLSLGLAPSATTTSLMIWSDHSYGMFPAKERKAWSSLVQLVWWNLWIERNARIFRNQRSPVVALIAKIVEEAAVWSRAGRWRANSLLDRPREPD